MVEPRYVLLGRPLMSCHGLSSGFGVEPGRVLDRLAFKNQLPIWKE
jgi:hypothetical protein